MMKAGPANSVAHRQVVEQTLPAAVQDCKASNGEGLRIYFIEAGVLSDVVSASCLLSRTICDIPRSELLHGLSFPKIRGKTPTVLAWATLPLRCTADLLHSQ